MSGNVRYRAILALPLALLSGLAGRLAPRARLALIATTAATLAACVGVYLVGIQDPSVIAPVLMFFFFGLPLVTARWRRSARSRSC